MKGTFITFEGGEGAGKTTQIEILAEKLKVLGRPILITRQPGGTRMGEKLREILVRKSDDPPGPLAELFLYAADRAHHVQSSIGPALKIGTVVLCDRYADATEAYQQWGRGLPPNLIKALNEIAAGEVWPDRTIVLDLPPEVGVRRSMARQTEASTPREERFELEALAFHEKVREGYLAIAERCPERVRVVCASGTPQEVAERVWPQIADLFAPLS